MTRMCWTGSDLTLAEPPDTGRPGAGVPPDEAPLVVDSWLVDNGRVRALDHHHARFLASCGRFGCDCAAASRFLRAVSDRMPVQGRWFPRVEAYRGGALALWLRPAPHRPTSMRLWVPPGPDPRRHPTVKGPDLAALAALRELARDAGADDAVLYTPDGVVLEAAHAALLWWRDGALCLPDPRLDTLPSVTARLATQTARRRGVPVRYERCHVDELLDYPLWTANALHGVRRATVAGGVRCAS